MDKRDIVHIPHGILLSHWKQWNNAICNMNGPGIIILSEVSQREKSKYIISLLCRILKNDTNECIYKTEIDL